MRNVIGICNLHDGPHLGKLTESRPLGVTSFLGRYALIDFTLSNFSNSGIDKVYTLVENYVFGVRNHIQDGAVWVSNTKTGFLRLAFNEKALANPKFNTDVSNILSSLSPLDKTFDCDYVIISHPFFLYSYDFRKAIKKHIESKAEMSLLFSRRNDLDLEYINCDLLDLSSDNVINKTRINVGNKKEGNVSLETYIINKDTFIKLIEEAKKTSLLFTIRRMIVQYVNNHTVNAKGIEFDGYVVPILSLNDYVRHSFDLLNYHNRSKLFLDDWPIYTTTHNTPPALYGENANVRNSFIANGCIIKGKVENSIISRDVIIEKGAIVKNSIIFTNSIICEDARLNYILSDKNVHLKEVKKLEGDEDDVLYIEQGAIV